MRARAASLVGALAVVTAALAGDAAIAQTPPVRLAAPSDCPQNANCIPACKRVYGIDPTSVFAPLKVADAGAQALDDELAEVAVVFSSNPQLSRPDILSLRDDKRMITDDHVIPIVRAATEWVFASPDGHPRRIPEEVAELFRKSGN